MNDTKETSGNQEREAEFSVQQTAAQLGSTAANIYKAIRDGRIAARREVFGPGPGEWRYRIAQSTIDEYKNRPARERWKTRVSRKPEDPINTSRTNLTPV